MWIDARIPIRFGLLTSRGPHEAVLAEGGAPGPGAWAVIEGRGAGHLADCACCRPRSGAAVALGLLFRQRATGDMPPFKAVLAAVGPEGEAAVREAVRDDPVAAARFRLVAG